MWIKNNQLLINKKIIFYLFSLVFIAFFSLIKIEIKKKRSHLSTLSTGLISIIIFLFKIIIKRKQKGFSKKSNQSAFSHKKDVVSSFKV